MAEVEKFKFSSISIKELVKEIDSLRRELNSIKKSHKVLVSEETLIKEWDNEDDARWDNL